MVRLAALVLAVSLYAAACGPKPPASISLDVTIQDVLESLEKHASSIQDLSGTAHVTVEGKGDNQKAVVQFRYIKPDGFRAYIKGFAGIDLALISALGESLTVYLPSDNLYIITRHRDAVLNTLLPESGLDIESFARVFMGTLPAREEWDTFSIVLTHYGGRVELSLEKDGLEYRYCVMERELRPVSEEVVRDGVVIWKKTVVEYGSAGGVALPSKVTIERPGAVCTLVLTQCVPNSGLTRKDLSFAIPSSAERINLECYEQQ